MSKYPRDEFDKVPESSRRQGVHRERMEPARSRSLPWLITVVVLAVLIGVSAYFILPRLGIGQVTAGTAATPSATASGGPSASAAASSSSPSATPTPSATPSPTASPTPTADKTQPVNVLNGAGVAGLAGSVSGQVAADGWPLNLVGNWQGAALQGSVIFYADASQLPNAQELSRLLGIPTVVQTAEVSPYVSVVLGPGYR